MDTLLTFLLFIIVASVGACSGISIYKDTQTVNTEKQSIGTIVMYVDGQELVATCLELEKDILDKNSGDIVYMKLEYRQYSEKNKGFNAVVNN